MKDSEIYYIMAKRITELEQQKAELIEALDTALNDREREFYIYNIMEILNKFKQEK